MDISERMSRIKGKGNQTTELRLIALFKQFGVVGWRRHQTFLKPGHGLRLIRPDFIFRKYKVAVFVDGCFWHACPKCYRPVKTNAVFWSEKVVRNRRRDRLATLSLKEMGWRVIRIWEHELSKPDASAKRKILSISP